MKGVAKLVLFVVKIVLKLLLYFLRKDGKTCKTSRTRDIINISDYNPRSKSRLRVSAVADNKVAMISKDKFSVTSTPASSGVGWSTVQGNPAERLELDASNIADSSTNKFGFLLNTTVSSSSGFGSSSNEDITADDVAADGHDCSISFQTEMRTLKSENRELTEKLRKNLTLLGSLGTSIEQTTRWRRGGGGSDKIQATISKTPVQCHRKRQPTSVSIDGLVRDRLWKELLEQHEENRRLKTFVNNVMYMLLENNPCLLEV